jgi:hypothetical protein
MLHRKQGLCHSRGFFLSHSKISETCRTGEAVTPICRVDWPISEHARRKTIMMGATFHGGLDMRKLIVATAIILASLSAGYARDMQSSGMGALMAPANPTVPPSLTPDPRLIGSAPLPPHHQPRRGDVGSPSSLAPDPEEARVDRMIGGICRGC